jgi:hypothetical protein
MSGNSSKRVGGEYGAVRANLDVHKLNTYIKAHVPVVSAPVQVQQFKVCIYLSHVSPSSDLLGSLDRYACSPTLLVLYRDEEQLDESSPTPHTS